MVTQDGAVGSVCRLPVSASPLTETTWVACNLHCKRPEWFTAPSRAAVNLLVSLQKDETLVRGFWTAHIKMRFKRQYG